MDEWMSPDGKIRKKVLAKGRGYKKPYYRSLVSVHIPDCPEQLSSFQDVELVIGDIDGELGRIVEICICTMLMDEKAQFTITLGLERITAVFELFAFVFNGLIYEWSALVKLQWADTHREKGAALYGDGNLVEAAHRFTKGLKVLKSIPIPVGYNGHLVEDVPTKDIQALTSKLYNNLACCYFRGKVYDMVVPLCKKVLEIDGDDIKALLKMGVAYQMERDYERAEEVLKRVSELEPNNTESAAHLVQIREAIRKANTRTDDLMRKMFRASITK